MNEQADGESEEPEDDQETHRLLIGFGLTFLSALAWMAAALTGERAPTITTFFAVVPASVGSAYALGWPWGVAVAVALGALSWFTIFPPQFTFGFAQAGHPYHLIVIVVVAAIAAIIAGRRRKR